MGRIRTMKNENIAAIILAAGTASRLGTPKQLVTIQGKKLLEHVIDLSLAFPFAEIIAVLGYQAAQIQQEIRVTDSRFHWLYNEQYETGQSSSLKRAIFALRPEMMHVMIFLGDVPFIKRETLHQLFETGRRIAKKTDAPFVVRPTYAGKEGHPVFFGNLERASFTKLTGDVGAKKLIKVIGNITLLPVNDDGILFDIDTPEDLQAAATFRLNEHEH